MLVASPRRRTRREKIKAQLVCPVHDIFMNAGTFDSARVPHLERARHEKSQHHFPVERIVSPNQRELRFTEKSVIGGDFLAMKTGEDVKVWLPGESPWAIVLAALPDGRLLARINNHLLRGELHSYQFGDVATFEIEETADYKIWKLAENQIKTGPTLVSVEASEASADRTALNEQSEVR